MSNKILSYKVEEHFKLKPLYGPPPFHEAIAELIRNTSKEKELRLVGDLLMVATIPSGHEELAATWRIKAEELHLDTDHIEQVVQHILHQKEGLEAQKKRKSISSF